MASVNKVILVGHCGQDPVIRTTQSGETVANVSLATSEKRKDANGEYSEQTEWHRLVFFGRVADVVADYVRKGSAIYVEGKIRTNKYTDQDGYERSITEILCSTMQFVGSKNDNQTVLVAPEGRDNENLPGQYAKDRPARTRAPTATRATMQSTGNQWNAYAQAKMKGPRPTPQPMPPRQTASGELEDDIPF